MRRDRYVWFSKLFNFYFFLYISFLCILEYLKIVYLLCTDVGLVHPTDFLRTRCRPQPKERPATTVEPTTVVGGPPARDAERVLRQVEWNLTTLTHIVPIVEIKDLSPSMKPHVVWVPWTLVQLFQHLVNVIVHYVRANRPCP
jgi:hypothetical protein